MGLFDKSQSKEARKSPRTWHGSDSDRKILRDADKEPVKPAAPQPVAPDPEQPSSTAGTTWQPYSVSEIHAGEQEERDQYRASLLRHIDNEARLEVEQELQQAARELIETQWAVIRQLADEYRQAITEVLEAEKRAIKVRVEQLRRSVIDIGTG